MNQTRRAERLITQNLVAAAATFEWRPEMTWSGVRQLSILIDLFCLHDRLAVLGRDACWMMMEKSSLASPLGLAIVMLDEFDERDDVVEKACTKLVSYLTGSLPIQDCRRLIEATLRGPPLTQRPFSPSPDEVEDFNTGADWVRTFPQGQDIGKALDSEAYHYRHVTFFVRTFLYLAYAEVMGLPLTPDETRTPAIEKMLRQEGNIRHRLRKALSEAFPNRFLTDEIELTRNVTPLASIVFDRAYPKKENIPAEIEKLRNELAPFRKRVQIEERALLSASGSKEVQARQKWDTVYKEIEEHIGRGKGPVTVSIKDIPNIVDAISGALGDPTKLPSAIKTLAGLPLDALQTFLRRRPAIEIFRLGPKIPNSASLRKTAHRLFGDIH
jgi:hypothetical protein